jgi:hypothetical protein
LDWTGLGLEQQEVKQRGEPGDAQQDSKEHFITLRAVVYRTGEHGTEDTAPGVEKAHAAANLGEVFPPEKITYCGPGDGKQTFENAK